MNVYIAKNTANHSNHSKPQQQLMSDSSEVLFYLPFVHTGVDCFSPITTKREIGPEPSQEQTKVMVLFLCA